MLKEIAAVLKKFDTFLVTTHLRPDGDSIGSEIVFLELLETLGKKAVALNDSPVPSLYKFLPGSEKIVTSLKRDFQPQAALVLDTPSLDRLGRIKEFVQKAPLIVNIDHHISNTCFGHINLVRVKAGATGEQVMNLLRYLKVQVKPSWAVCLYTAIITDTGSFRYTNTTPATHRLAAKLIEAGVKPTEIAEQIYESNSIDKLRFLSGVLKGIKTSPDGEIAWVTVPPYRNWENDEELITYPRSLKGVKIAILFRELKSNRVKISFRSKGGVDVNTLAQKFGGGGHRAASGCVVKGGLASVRRKILAAAADYLR